MKTKVASKKFSSKLETERVDYSKLPNVGKKMVLSRKRELYRIKLLQSSSQKSKQFKKCLGNL